MKIFFILFIGINWGSLVIAQDENCSFNMYDGAPELEFTKVISPYSREAVWTKDDFDDLQLYSMFCEEMFEEASTEIYKTFETEETLHVVEHTGHENNYEIWDVVLRSKNKTYHIHFQFELSEE